MITIIAVEPGKPPYGKSIHSGLKSLQHEVGGCVQIIYPFDDCAVICHEEGKLLGLPLNRALYDEDGNMYDIIAGKFLIAGLTEDDIGSLTDWQVEKYMKIFKYPEAFLKLGNNIIVIR